MAIFPNLHALLGLSSRLTAMHVTITYSSHQAAAPVPFILTPKLDATLAPCRVSAFAFECSSYRIAPSSRDIAHVTGAEVAAPEW
jgi:hypothetical protein